MTPDLHIIGLCPFTDDTIRQVFEDAEGQQYVLDEDGELAAGQSLPPADEPTIARNET
jgi:hypothetical protein